MLRLTTQKPDWKDLYRVELRRRKMERVWNGVLNLLCLIGAFGLAYFAMTLCSLLEPIL